MQMLSPTLLNQAGLILGFAAAILLAFSSKVGVISKGGSIIFEGLDPMDPSEDNLKRVLSSHWRNRYFTPLGWGMLDVPPILSSAAIWSPIPLSQEIGREEAIYGRTNHRFSA